MKEIEEIKTMIGYKIFEKTENGYKNLFHVRKNTYEIGDNITAEKKQVYESYNKKTKQKNMYLSGIHIVESEELCRKYLRRFKDKTNKIIVECFIYGYNIKPNGNKGVYLADEIFLMNEIQI